MRTEHRSTDILALAKELNDVVHVLRRVASRMSDLGLEVVSIHANTASNKHLRALWDWAQRVDADAEMQFRAFSKEHQPGKLPPAGNGSVKSTPAIQSVTKPSVPKAAAGKSVAKPVLKSAGKSSTGKAAVANTKPAKAATAKPPAKPVAMKSPAKSKSTGKVAATKPAAPKTVATKAPKAKPAG